MFNARFPLLSSALATGIWGVSHGSTQWQVLIQVVCAVVVSVSIFLAVLAMGEIEVRVRNSKDDENARDAKPRSRLRYPESDSANGALV